MDCVKVGKLIYKLRKEKNMTQKQLADAMNISDKTISKWECGLGCPDVSLLSELSGVLGINIEKLLEGTINTNKMDVGNMIKTKFYMCPVCGNVITATGNADISCCGRKVDALQAVPCDEKHDINVQVIDDEYYITFSHDMTKSHYINFIAYLTVDRIYFARLYPEQGSEVRMPRIFGGKFYIGCNKHGLFIKE